MALGGAEDVEFGKEAQLVLSLTGFPNGQGTMGSRATDLPLSLK